jgi:branched-subunit amino acid transport protein
MKRLFIVVVGMALVTYLPRMLPLMALPDLKLPLRVKAFLQFIPCAALGALIFPGIITSSSHTGAVAAGGVMAAVLAYLRLNIMLVVLGAVLAVYLWLTFAPPGWL